MGRQKPNNRSSSSDYSEDDSAECPYERIVGIRKDNNKVEYLIKFINKSYKEVKWVSDKKVGSYKEGAAMISKISKNNPVSTAEPYFDPDYCKVDRILQKKGEKYLVKWLNLGYDQITEESNIDDEDIEEYNTRKSAI